jgi:hypothetical protein
MGLATKPWLVLAFAVSLWKQHPEELISPFLMKIRT